MIETGRGNIIVPGAGHNGRYIPMTNVASRNGSIWIEQEGGLGGIGGLLEFSIEQAQCLCEALLKLVNEARHDGSVQ